MNSGIQFSRWFKKKKQVGLMELGRLVLRHLYSKVKGILTLGWLPWHSRPAFYRNLARLLIAPRSSKKRILGIWDYKNLPWSVGDPLLFVAYLNVLRRKYNSDVVDYCVVYDKNDPAGKRPANSDFTSSSVQDYALEFLPLFNTSECLGSIYQFNSRERFNSFLKIHVDEYQIFPPLGKHLAETYNFENAGLDHFEEFSRFYKQNDFIPHLRVGERDMSWAYWFYRTHLGEQSIPVVLSMKNTKHSAERNANSEIWLKFIDRCKVDFPEVTFIIIGTREEIFEELRSRNNVLVAKDYGTTLMEDIALIRGSSLYMGTNSGINVVAIFSDLPYLIFQWPIWTLNQIPLNNKKQFFFAKDTQKIFGESVDVTVELLFHEFAQLYGKISIEDWHAMALKNKKNKNTLPTTVGGSTSA